MTSLTLEEFIIWELIINVIFLFVALPLGGYFMEKWACWRLGLFKRNGKTGGKQAAVKTSSITPPSKRK